MKIYAGIEGGASFSKVILVDENGNIMVRLDSEPSTNIMLLTKQEWLDRIYKMTIKAVSRLSNVNGNDKSPMKLESLGLCLSGCENEEENQELCELLKDKFQELCENYSIASDTVGSILTCSPNGGIVLIAGTGSNSLLIYPDGSSFRCGGWGHIIGDEGSAYWISLKIVRYLIEHEENYRPIPYDITECKQAVFDHFKVDNFLDLLKPFYHEFDKSKIALLCARIAKLALEKNDLLSKKIFQEAGKVLAQHAKALLPKVDSKQQVSIICVGSVFKSWQLLEKSFLQEIGSYPKRIMILYVTETSAIGAAYFAAKYSLNIQLPIDHRKNYKILCCVQNGKKIPTSSSSPNQ